MIGILATRSIGQSFFSEKAFAVGINHFHLSTDLIGAGIAVFDYNNDGWEDIWITGGNNQDVLYANQGDGTFTEVGFTAGLLVTAAYHTKGVVTGDINNDGWRDVFLVTRTGSPNLLLLNNADGTFINIAGFAGIADDIAWSGAATMADFNSDGWLDIYVGNYLESSDFLYDSTGTSIVGYAHTCTENYLYLNNGDLTFYNAASFSGAGDAGCALATMATDFNDDGTIDLLVANDFGEWVLPNAALQNNEGFFVNNNQLNGMNQEMYGMGIASGDIDLDGDQDYYLTNIGSNVLLENDNGHFTDVASVANVANTQAGNNLTVGWGAAFLDIDNDKDLDLFVANGFIAALSFNQTSVENPDKLYLNNIAQSGETKDFIDATVDVGLGDTGFARGMAHGDFDKDGDQDLVVVQASGTADPDIAHKVLFYENELANDHHWLGVKLEGTISNKDAFGAKIRIVADGDSWEHELVSGSGHASQNTSIAHFGLGAAEQADSLVIKWPMGGKQILTDIEANQQLTVVEDTALFTSVQMVENAPVEVVAAPNPFKEKTRLYITNEGSKELELVLTNLMGQEVERWTTKSSQITLNCQHLPAGTYVLQVKAEHKFINTLKLVLL